MWNPWWLLKRILPWFLLLLWYFCCWFRYLDGLAANQIVCSLSFNLVSNSVCSKPDFWNITVSQGSVAMSSRCGGMCNDFTFCSKFCSESSSERILKIDHYFMELFTWVGCLFFWLTVCYTCVSVVIIHFGINNDDEKSQSCFYYSSFSIILFLFSAYLFYRQCTTCNVSFWFVILRIFQRSRCSLSTIDSSTTTIQQLVRIAFLWFR